MPAFDAWKHEARITTDAEIAVEVGIDPTTFSLIRRGVHGCSARVVAGFRYAYGVPLDFGPDKMYLYDPELRDSRSRAPHRSNTTR